MEKKELKNIKMPAYSVEIGSGVFVATVWKCQDCQTRTTLSNYPPPGYMGKCPVTGYPHDWAPLG